LALLYTGIYVLVALAVVVFAKGYRLRTFVVMLALGVVVDYCVSLAAFKRVAVAHLRAQGLVSPDMVRGVDAYREVVQGEVVYVLVGAVTLAALALLDAVRGRRGSRDAGRPPGPADA